MIVILHDCEYRKAVYRSKTWIELRNHNGELITVMDGNLCIRWTKRIDSLVNNGASHYC